MEPKVTQLLTNTIKHQTLKNNKKRRAHIPKLVKQQCPKLGRLSQGMPHQIQPGATMGTLGPPFVNYGSQKAQKATRRTKNTHTKKVQQSCQVPVTVRVDTIPSQPSQEPASQEASQSASQPASEPASQPASQPVQPDD